MFLPQERKKVNDHHKGPIILNNGPQGPFPYVDGLIFQITKNFGTLDVIHLPRTVDKSNYTLRKLIDLWVRIFVNFSVLPLRFSTYLGLFMSGLGFLGMLAVIVEYLFFDIPIQGWASLMVVGLIFSGAQLLILGLLGEYLGRVYLTLNELPQYIVREVIGPAASSADASPKLSP